MGVGERERDENVVAKWDRKAELGKRERREERKEWVRETGREKGVGERDLKKVGVDNRDEKGETGKQER